MCCYRRVLLAMACAAAHPSVGASAEPSIRDVKDETGKFVAVEGVGDLVGVLAVDACQGQTGEALGLGGVQWRNGVGGGGGTGGEERRGQPRHERREEHGR